jgi:hypothetical protein
VASCTPRTSADPHGGMSARSAAGAECAPTPTWPGGPKIGRRRPARNGPRDSDYETDGSTPCCGQRARRVALP